jgi:hypothetical protein
MEFKAGEALVDGAQHLVSTASAAIVALALF